MQTDLIDTFLDLAETRSFNRTADRLGITQSTVSSRIAALERHVGARLFSRSRAGTALTTAGLRFEPHARRLSHDWTEALRASRTTGNVALSMRVGLQIDLAGPRIGDWVTQFRRLLPDTSFYLELDYSNQMCADVLSGHLDLSVLYSPRPYPDLYLESVGEVRYRLVSSEGRRHSDVNPDRYIRGDYSPMFEQQHRRLYPDWTEGSLASGQTPAVVGLISALGGSAFVREDAAEVLVADGGLALVEDVPAIPQTVYVAIHARYRHARVYRRLIAIVRQHFGG